MTDCMPSPSLVTKTTSTLREGSCIQVEFFLCNTPLTSHDAAYEITKGINVILQESFLGPNLKFYNKSAGFKIVDQISKCDDPSKSYGPALSSGSVLLLFVFVFFVFNPTFTREMEEGQKYFVW